MDEKSKIELKKFFLVFSARNSISEADIEKLERVIHSIKISTVQDIEEICDYIVRKNLLEKPEEDIIDFLKKEKLA